MEVNGQLHNQAALNPGTQPPVPIEQETGWTPELVWVVGRRERISWLSNSLVAQPVAWSQALIMLPQLHTHNNNYDHSRV